MISNHSLMQETNVNLVISQIINNPEISRSEISNHTGLNKATVSEIVKKLIAESYVVETGTGNASTSGGRRPILLRINKKSGISISFDIRFDKISYMINYLNGEIIEVQSYETISDKNNIVKNIEKIVLKTKEKMSDIPFGVIASQLLFTELFQIIIFFSHLIMI